MDRKGSAEARTRQMSAQGRPRRFSVENFENVARRMSVENVLADYPKFEADVEEIEYIQEVSEKGRRASIDIDEYSEAEGTKILRKVDFRLVPILTFLYLIAFVDRSNIGNAKIAGMNDDLQLVGMQYNIALTIFFIPYALLEVPSNIILKLTRPSIWIPSIMLAWGIVLTTMGLVNNFAGLCICRFFLGVAEAGFFPGATYLLTCWYKRYEVQSRMVFFYAGASLSGAFSGLLAYAIQFMKGIAGLPGWKWIFILEGIFTVLVAIGGFFVLPDSPQSCKFLNDHEKKFLVRRLQLDTGSGHGAVTNEDKLTAKFVLNAMKEWRIWFAILIFWGNSIGVYGFTYTVPTVIKDLGYSAANAQLMTIPIYVCAMVFTIIWSIWSDRVQQRFPFILSGIFIAICGFIGLLVVPKHGSTTAQYAVLFIAASGLYSFLIPVVCWIGNNTAPSSKRAVGMALLVSGGNLGGIAGSNIYVSWEAPYYWTGYGFSLAVCCVAFVATIVLRWSYARENARRDKMTAEEINAKYTGKQLLEMGDRSPHFRYTL